MDRPSTPPKVPAIDLDSTTAPCTPGPDRKRPPSHVGTLDADHRAKRFKMEDQTQEEAKNIDHEDIVLSNRPRFASLTVGEKLESQSPEEAGSLSLASQQGLSALVANYEKEMHGLTAQAASLKAKIYDLEAQIPIKDQQLQNLKEFIAVQHLQPAATMGPDDSAVTTKFAALKSAITNLALVELNGPPFYKPTRTDHKALFAHLTATEEDYKDYLGDSSGFKAFFFEGVIWTKLIERLLGSPLSAFLDMKESVIRDQVYVYSGASPQKFHAWRAYTADFLEDAFGSRALWRPNGTKRPLLVGNLVELLSRYSTSGPGNVAALTPQLEDVVDKAVNLAWVMAKSRAHWVCSFPTCPQTNKPHSFVYRREYVKVEKSLQGGRRNVVDLIGRPSMLKWGDSSGEQYDTCVIVDKAAALVFGGTKPNNADTEYMDIQKVHCG